MPTFSGNIQDRQIILVSTISLSASAENIASRMSFNALLDTGAQTTMVSRRVVQNVGLTPIGSIEMLPASGDPFMADKYLARIDIPIEIQFRQPEGDIGTEQTLRGMDLQVAQLPYDPHNYDVLLGMDFLQGLHLTIYRDTFILSS